LKVIYDGAHAFGCTYNDKALLSYGDISTCSFHATKIFHTVEGGCIICEDDEIARKLMLYRQFGHVYDDYLDIGLNAKNSEFHAAMGLAVLPEMPAILNSRKQICNDYRRLLVHESIQLLNPQVPGFVANDSYFPMVLATEEILLQVKQSLADHNINTRRYFYPSLNELPFIVHQPCPVSEDISRRVLCLPVFYGLSADDQQRICQIVLETLS
jgi:dTDP-4-amino-4,6-dideoxygalactose transaminase